MSPPEEAPANPPTKAEINDLKRLAAGIITDQGNRFIKELLRDKKIRIGDTKEDFRANLDGAIESGKLRMDDVKEWLDRVEGWGNQHVYLYNISPALRKVLTGPKVVASIQANPKLRKVWNADRVQVFPDEPTLASVSFDDFVLRLVWQEASPGWTREKDKDREEQRGLDTYWFEAYRKLEHRAVTRFEVHLKKGLAGLFIPGPVEDDEHRRAIEEAKSVVNLLLDFEALEEGQLDLGVVSRNFDQQNLPNNVQPNPSVRTSRSRLTSGDAYVEFASSASGRAFWEENAVLEVRNAVRREQLSHFRGTEGVFLFESNPDEAKARRLLRVQLYAADNRIRFWAQMKAGEVWTILTAISGAQA